MRAHDRRFKNALRICAVLLVPAMADRAGGSPAPVATASGSASTETTRAALILSRATFGPRPGDLDRVLQMGVERWLDRQLHPEQIDDAALEAKLARFDDIKLGPRELLDKYPKPDRAEREARKKAQEARESGEPMDEATRETLKSARGDGMDGPREIAVELSEAKVLRAVESERQLAEVLTDFWFNHFNVYARKSLPTLMCLPSYERDAIRPNVLGSFQDLLFATAQHPAMLLYLDNWTNTREGFNPREAAANLMRDEMGMGRRGRGGRGGFGRGDGFGGDGFGRRGAFGQADQRPDKQKRKSGINENYARELMELHTLGVDGGYSQQDVIEVAKCLTGWTIVSPELVTERLRNRDRGEGGGGPESMIDGSFHFVADAHVTGPKMVLGHTIDAGGVDDGRDVIRLLCQEPATAHFVCKKLATKFVSDHPSEELVSEMAAAFQKTGGDIRAVVKTMFLSERFVPEALSGSKVKTPFELAVSTVRATGSKLMGGPGLAKSLQQLGMPLYLCQPPTGYDEEAETWLSAGNMLTRIRFTGELLSGSIPGVRVPTPPEDLKTWAAEVLPESGRELSEESAATIREAMGEFPGLSTGSKLQEMALLLASPSFQRQ
ncbi:MAG: DUF1800 domain-containing protein [Acidobacteriota bacterium]